MSAPGKVYLGDSVYAAIEAGRLKLTTENGLGASNTIYLEPEVFQALQQYMAAPPRAGRSHEAAE